ncbi:GMC family oxidoreductase [Roseomonas sp. BN140053]|uniref:GMC family oxidoreductase n=1 Tax=Roseomonas sp. BN140053 TaxID=3391898 RepID=UPI0039E8106F
MPATATATAERDAGCNVAVVGAGASGLAVAWTLARRGLRVAVLEQGEVVDQRPAPSLEMDWERALQSRFHPDPNIRRLPSDYPVAVLGTEIRPATYSGVGGATLRWGAHFPRLRPSDFRVRSLDGVAEDWPIAYRDLEPWFDLNDRMTGVSGLAGDPANPPRPARPLPPLPLGPGPARLARAFDRLGWHWWPSDAAICTAPRDGREACNNCGPCGVGCPRLARASADVVYGRPALAAGAEIRSGTRVLRVELDATGRVAGLLYSRGGERRFLPARTVVMAANGMGTARLLLCSASERHPEGLGNASGLVGRNLMHHPTAMVTGLFPERLDGHRGPFACALFSQEFVESDPSRGFLRGYQMQATRGGGPVQTALGGYMARVPWGRGHHDAFAATFTHSVSLTVTTEDLPDPENRVTLDPQLRDGDGLPAPALRYRVGENTRRMLAHGVARASEVLRAAGATGVSVNPLVAAAGFHFLGTTRMGEDPARAVTDAVGRVHGVPGLLAVDGGVFVTAGAVNPTSTIQAVALRAADALANRLERAAA